MTRIDSEGRDLTQFPSLWDDEDYFVCPECNAKTRVDECDVAGACRGNVFCIDCNTEIAEDGTKARPCGDCFWCLMNGIEPSTSASPAPPRETTARPTAELLANLRKSSGNAWDDVVDVRAELAELRGTDTDGGHE